MNRTELLAEWKRYPCAPKGCQSLLRWNGEAGWIGGRLGVAGDRLFLHSQPNQNLTFSVESRGLTEGFQPGDHVALHLSAKDSDGLWQADRILLLAPAEKEVALSAWMEWRPFVEKVRSFFLQKKFMEIETPSLTICPGLEPALEAFSTRLSEGSASQTRYLPTSPEIHLKKALCLGFSDIFEIKTCYRNGEISRHHQPEFHMLEWYRAYSDLDLVIADLCELVQSVGGEKPTVTNFQALFKEHLQVDLQPTTDYETYWRWCERENLRPAEGDTKTDLFHRLWIDRIEKHLTKPVIVRDFPPEQAALARIADSGWADRFEFFWNGLEIANAFHEVNDPVEQARRWQMEKAERRRLGRTDLPHDPQLLEQMQQYGLPPTGGIALGLERLFMAAHGVQDIRRLKVFSY